MYNQKILKYMHKLKFSNNPNKKKIYLSKLNFYKQVGGGRNHCQYRGCKCSWQDEVTDRAAASDDFCKCRLQTDVDFHDHIASIEYKENRY
jgi:hypothetical protein